MVDAKPEERTPQMPPEGVSSSELFVALMANPVPHEIVDFPIRDKVLGNSIGKVAVVPLSPEELMTSRAVASDYAAQFTPDKKKPAADAETSDFKDNSANETIVQILWRALRDPNDKTLKKPAFPVAAVLRRAPFTADILGVLFKQYQRTCTVCGPIVATMTDAEKDAWCDALEEGAAQFPLELLSSAMQSDLLMHFAVRCRSLRTGSGSSGSPADGSSSDTGKPNLPPSESAPSVPPADEKPSDASASADILEIPKP